MKKRLILLSLLLAMCGGCASVGVGVGLKAAYMAFQVIKMVAGSGDKAEQQETEASDESSSE